MSCVLPFASGEHSLLAGTILHSEGNRLLVQCPSGTVRACRAASCLLQPETHDSVLLAVPDNGAAWVLAVLVRHGERAMLDLPAHSTLRADSMTLDGKRISCAAESLAMEAGHLSIKGGVLSFSGRLLLHQFQHICTAARNVWEYCRRRESTCDERREQTRGLAQSSAGRMRITAETSWRVRTECADVQAREHMLLNAGHIKIG